MEIEVTTEWLITQLGDYTILDRKRSDSFGTVFSGTKKKLQKPVKIRILPISSSAVPGGIDEINNYLASCAQFQHPNLVEIVDFGETSDGFIYLVTSSYLHTLGTVNFKQVSEVEKIYAQLLDVTDWLQGFETIHGWINPELLGIDDSGNLKLDGFGLAGIGEIIGESLDSSSWAAYLAPEDVDHGLNRTVHSEIFSIGVCLYHSLTGSVPRGVFQMPSEINPAIETRFDVAITKALQSDPAKRFENLAAFRQALSGAGGIGSAVPTKKGVVTVTKKSSPVVNSRPNPALPAKVPTVTSKKVSVVPKTAGSAPSRARQKRNDASSSESQFPWLMVGGLAGIGILVLIGVMAFKGKKPRPIADRTPPGAPLEVWASDTTLSSITVRWTTSVDNVGIKEYKVFRNGKLIATPKNNEFVDTELVDNVGYTYRIQAIDTSGNESPRTPEMVLRTAATNKDELRKQLGELRTLVNYCPLLEKYIKANLLLAFLVYRQGLLDELWEDAKQSNPSFAAHLESDKFVREVASIYQLALLPTPVRFNRSGPLIGWTAKENSQVPAKNLLKNFSGPDDGIVSIAGTIASGMALTNNGRISVWGSANSATPSFESIVAIDSENGGFAALTETGHVHVWGTSKLRQSDVDGWRKVVRIALGENHILGLTTDFKILSAGDNSQQQTDIPPDWIKGKSIISVEAIGNFSYALSADGTIYSWGGHNSPAKKHLSFSNSGPLKLQTTGSFIVVGQMGNGDVMLMNSKGNQEKVKCYADTDFLLPELSNDGKIRAILQEKDRWKLITQSDVVINIPYWESVARGASDLIIGDEEYLAVKGGPPVGTVTRPPGETAAQFHIPNYFQQNRQANRGIVLAQRAFAPRFHDENSPEVLEDAIFLAPLNPNRTDGSNK